MRKLLKRVVLLILLLVVGLTAPVAYIELACRPTETASTYEPILLPEHHRAEGKTLLTYPEWHIVHAYDDYAKVISTSDPHDYRYLSSIGGFWTSLCSLSQASGPHGGFPSSFKQTIYTIGVSFSAELLAKALYEETIGRAATWMRGDTRAPLDDLSADQAEQYSAFLQQVPWYRWDFARDAQALTVNAGDALRDRERRFALGIEYRTKARHAKVIADAVANMEPDALRLRLIVTGLSNEELTAFDSLNVIAEHDQGIEIDTPRYRELTVLLSKMAQANGDFVEIAGNDDILLTATSDNANLDEALYSFTRQGYGDFRHLILLPVTDLADTLRSLDGQSLHLEHIHDF